MKLTLKHIGLCMFAMTLLSTGGFAQKYEIHPLVGRTVPTKWADRLAMKSVSIVGVKVAVFADETTQIEGEFEYLPHFVFRGTDPKTRGFVGASMPLEMSFLPGRR